MISGHGETNDPLVVNTIHLVDSIEATGRSRPVLKGDSNSNGDKQKKDFFLTH